MRELRASLRQKRSKVLLVEHADEIRDLAVECNGKTDDRRETRHPQPAFHVADVRVGHAGEIGKGPKRKLALLSQLAQSLAEHRRLRLSGCHAVRSRLTK